MTKKLDPDIKALRAIDRAIKLSSSERTAKINIWYFWDKLGRPDVQGIGRVVSLPKERV